MKNYRKAILVFFLVLVTSCSSIPSSTQFDESAGNKSSGSDDTLEEVLKETGFIQEEQPEPVAKFDQKALEKALSRMLGDLKEQAEQIAKNSDSLLLDADGRYVIKRGDSLSEILEKIDKGSNINLNLLKRAFVAANPKAFKRSNPNWMYANAKLRFPEEKDFRKILFRNENVEETKTELEDPYSDWIRFPAR
jgi:nucleoid-associated protein YgaU